MVIAGQIVRCPTISRSLVSVVGALVGSFAEAWLAQQDATNGLLHVALTAKSRAHVDAFHAAAIRAGGIDNGPPGLRRDYHSDYYAAFVFDPDGHNIEAVCHTAPD